MGAPYIYDISHLRVKVRYTCKYLLESVTHQAFGGPVVISVGPNSFCMLLLHREKQFKNPNIVMYLLQLSIYMRKCKYKI